jgi:hypothetical protein
MKSTQAWGWLAAGVLALGVNGYYHDGGAARVRRVADRLIERIAERSQPLLASATGRMNEFVANAKMLTAGDETASCHITTALARLQSPFLQKRMARMSSGVPRMIARSEAMSAREEAGLARTEANRAWIDAQVARVRVAPVAFHLVVCPRVRVNIPRMRISAPLVNVGPLHD